MKKNQPKRKPLWAVQYADMTCGTNINLPLPVEMKSEIDDLSAKLGLPAIEFIRIAVSALIAELR